MRDSLLQKLNKALRASFSTTDKLFFYKKHKKEGQILLGLYKKAFSVVDRRPDSTLFAETGMVDIDPSLEKVYHCGVFDLSIEDQKDAYESTMSLMAVSYGTVVTREIDWKSGKPIIFLEWVTRVTMPSLKALVSSLNMDEDKLGSEIKAIMSNINNDGDIDVK